MGTQTFNVTVIQVTLFWTFAAPYRTTASLLHNCNTGGIPDSSVRGVPEDYPGRLLNPLQASRRNVGEPRVAEMSGSAPLARPLAPRYVSNVTLVVLSMVPC